MGPCPFKVGCQIVSDGITMTIQFIDYKTCCYQCIYYDNCLKKFMSVEVFRSCPICKI